MNLRHVAQITFVRFALWGFSLHPRFCAVPLERKSPFMVRTYRVCCCIPPPPAAAAAAAAESLQSFPTLRDPIDGSPPGSPIPGILQARTLEWVAISFSSAWKWKVNLTSLSCVRLLATPWTAAYQAPTSMGYSRQEYWSGWPLPSPEGGVFL